jgi:hypothetical protein
MSVSMYFHLCLQTAPQSLLDCSIFINIQRVFFAGVPEAALNAEDEIEEEPAECVPTSCLT